VARELSSGQHLIYFLNNTYPGQVLGLFVVGIGEYGAVWLGTDWDQEVQRGRERNLLEAKRMVLHADQLEQA